MSEEHESQTPQSGADPGSLRWEVATSVLKIFAILPFNPYRWPGLRNLADWSLEQRGAAEPTIGDSNE